MGLGTRQPTLPDRANLYRRDQVSTLLYEMDYPHDIFCHSLSVLILYYMMLYISVSNRPWWEIYMLYIRANRCHEIPMYT